MKIGKIAGQDISSIFRNRLIRVSVIAILIVPMLYSLCYLAAFWDPYGRLDQLPVAVLNLDAGAQLDGKAVNYGDDVVNDLKKNDEVKWSFITQGDLKDGLQNTEYYSLFTIPEDFSANIVNAKTEKPKVAELVYTSNEAKNFLASQISGNVETRLKDQVSASVTKEYTKAAFDGLYDAKDGLTQAAEGSGELDDGLAALNGKIPDLTDGIFQLSSGSSALYTGLGQLNAKVPALADGTAQLAGGAGQVAGGADRLASNGPALTEGAGKLADGAQRLDRGLTSLSSQTPALADGTAALQDGTAEMLASVKKLKQGADGVDEIVGGISQKLPSPGTVDTAIQSIIGLINSGQTQSAIALLDGVSSQYSAQYGEISGYLGQAQDINNQLQDGLSSLAYTLDPANRQTPDGNPTFAAGLDQLKDGVDAANAGIQKLADGAAELNAGLGSLNGQLPSLTAGIDSLQGGAQQVADGARQLNSQVPALQSGARQLYDGSSALQDGFGALTAQVPTLTDGVSQLADGSRELKTKLADGAKYIDGNLVNSSETMAEYVSDPVTVSNQPINPVPDYGTGFAPYFIPLSLWVGAILMFFIISPKADPRLQANSAQSALGKYLSYAFVGVLQAVMVGLAVLALGLRPNDTGMYFLTIIVMSLTAVAIVQTLISLLGDAGRLIAIVLLILQLTADAGTFPLELVPGFFKALNPFMPFTYCVTALRQAISGSDTVLIWQCIGVLAIFLGAFLVITALFQKRAGKLQDKISRLRPAE